MGRTAFVLVLAFMILAPSVKAADDPWEGVNRQVFEFNEWTDRWFLRPVAVGLCQSGAEVRTHRR